MVVLIARKPPRGASAAPLDVLPTRCEATARRPGSASDEEAVVRPSARAAVDGEDGAIGRPLAAAVARTAALLLFFARAFRSAWRAALLAAFLAALAARASLAPPWTFAFLLGGVMAVLERTPCGGAASGAAGSGARAADAILPAATAGERCSTGAARAGAPVAVDVRVGSTTLGAGDAGAATALAAVFGVGSTARASRAAPVAGRGSTGAARGASAAWAGARTGSTGRIAAEGVPVTPVDGARSVGGAITDGDAAAAGRGTTAGGAPAGFGGTDRRASTDAARPVGGAVLGAANAALAPAAVKLGGGRDAGTGPHAFAGVPAAGGVDAGRGGSAAGAVADGSGAPGAGRRSAGFGASPPEPASLSQPSSIFGSSDFGFESPT